MIFTDSPKPQFVYANLLEEQSDLEDAIVSCTESVGTASTIVDAYKFAPQSLDELALEKIALINTKKQQIVTILTNNYTQYSSGSGGCGIGTTTTNITGNILNVVVAGTASTFSYTVGIADSIGVRAEIREDTLYSWTFSALEDVDVSATFYEDTGSYQQVTSSTLGIGKTDWLITDVSNLQSIHTSSPLLGYYYPIVKISPTCNAINASVTTLINDIISIRSDISNLLPDINVLKDRKTEKQLDLLYASVSLTDTNNRLTEINNSISAMEENQQTINDFTP
jgi:hypothetical protein